jgi:hypothetical protein
MKPLLLSLLLAAAAFAQKVNVEFDPGAAFPRYRTFAIRDGRLNSRNPELNSELVKKRIEFDIQRDLTAKGLAMVASPGPADLIVNYTFGGAREIRPEPYPVGWRGWGGWRVAPVPYAEGRLVIDLRDSATHSMVWRAIAEVEKSSPHKVEEKIDDMVRKAVKKYPPKH